VLSMTRSGRSRVGAGACVRGRRLLVEQIALVFGARQLGDALAGFPELTSGPGAPRRPRAVGIARRLASMRKCWSGSLSDRGNPLAVGTAARLT
jgi:hypothetical protein